MAELGDRPVVHVLTRQDLRKHEVERRRLREHPTRGHAEDGLAVPEGEPQEAAGMRRSAVALHASAEQRESAEHGVERIERARAGDDEDLGPGASQRGQLVGDDARRAAREAHW